MHLRASPLQHQAQIKRDQKLPLHHEDGLAFQIGAIYGCGSLSRATQPKLAAP